MTTKKSLTSREFSVGCFAKLRGFVQAAEENLLYIDLHFFFLMAEMEEEDFLVRENVNVLIPEYR